MFILDKLRRTAVTHSIINGHAHVLSYLLKSGADPNDTDSSGNSLLHYAVAYGWWFCIKLLLDAGVSINVSNDWKVMHTKMWYFTCFRNG